MPAPRSAAVVRLLAIELAPQRLPRQPAFRRFGGGLPADADLHGFLNAAGLLKVIHVIEGLSDAAADSEQAVVAQDQAVARAEVADQTLALAEIVVGRNPFVVVHADVAVKLEADLVERQQGLLL